MAFLIRLGDCARYSKERNLEKPNWHCYDDFKVVSASEVTEELLVAYPYEYYSAKTKLFFDYDEKSDDTTYVHTKRNQIRDRLMEHCRHFRDGFVFTESTSNPNKVSFHVIFRQHYIVRGDFIKEDELDLFTKLVGSENFPHIDHQVYGKKTCFRLPYGTVGCQGHSDKVHPHLPVVPHGERVVLSDYILSLPDTTETKFYSSQLGRAMQKQLEEDARMYQDDSENAPERSEKLVRMLGMVKPQRFQQYNQWCALMVLMKTHKLPIDLFLQLSEASEYAYFDEIKCRTAWRNCREAESFGIPTVLGWLKQDGVDIKKLFPTQSPLLKELLNGWYRQGDFTDQNIATALYNHYKDSLIYTDQGWFHYKGKWVMGKQEFIFHPVMVLLSTELLNYIDNGLDKQLKRMAAEQMDEDELNTEKTRAKMREKLRKDVNNLQRSSTIKRVLEASVGLFLDNSALDTFDTKAHWFCFTDQKAINMRTLEEIRIEAKDRILTTCGYDLPPRKQEDIDKVRAVIEGILPEHNIPSLLSALSLLSYGGNINELLLFFKGEGRNGKGMLISLLQKVLGDYFYALPTEVLTTHSKGAGRANPELAQCRWARCVMASEPDGKQEMVKTTINLLTGRDTITVRQLHCTPTSFVPRFTLAIMGNDAPKISGGVNDAIKERLVFQMFPFTFVENPEEGTNQRKIDTSKKDVLREDVSYRNGLLYLLLETWNKNQGKYIPCDDSKEEQNIYAKDNNPIIGWVEENYQPSDKPISIKIIYSAYTQACGEAHSSNKFKDFLKQMGVKVVEDRSNGHKVYLQHKPKPVLTDVYQQQTD